MSHRLRHLLACLAVLMLLPSMIQPFPAASESICNGDCNDDGVTDINDAYDLTLCLTYPNIFHLMNPEAVDFDADGTLTAIDLTLLKRMLLAPPPPETATLLVYLCGSDLETQAAEATSDLTEMLSAARSEHMTIVIETGGASKWRTSMVDETSNYHIIINDDGTNITKCPNGRMNMASSETLEHFIRMGTASYPAEHYGLVLWDHGGGPVYGLCYDELTDQSLSIAELQEGVKQAGVHFDWIGFDACLMADAEVAFALRDAADYMVASQELESGIGWSYTNFLSKWGANPSMDTAELCHLIAKDMVGANRSYRLNATMAVYDLRYAESMMVATYAFIDAVFELYQQEGILPIVAARSEAMDFGEGEYDLVDLLDFAEKLGVGDIDALRAAVSNLLVTNQTYGLEGANGVSIWFFENYPEEGAYLQYVYPPFGLLQSYVDQLSTMAKAATSYKSRAFTERTDGLITAFLEAMQQRTVAS